MITPEISQKMDEILHRMSHTQDQLFTLQNYLVYSGFLIFSLLTGLAIFKLWSKKYDLLPVNRERLCVQGGSAFIGSLIFYICRSLYA